MQEKRGKKGKKKERKIGQLIPLTYSNLPTSPREKRKRSKSGFCSIELLPRGTTRKGEREKKREEEKTRPRRLEGVINSDLFLSRTGKRKKREPS